MKYLVLVFSIFITSCASIVDSSTDFINIAANDGSNVKATITSKAGAQTVHLPTLITVSKSCRDITVEVIEDNKIQQSSYDIVYHANPWVYANLLIPGFGILGIVIDGLTGKACTYDNTVIVPVTRKLSNDSQKQITEQQEQYKN